MNVPVPPPAAPEQIDAFIARWQGREGGQERANYALFLTGLCRVLDLPEPDPADATHEHNDYVFERVVTRHRDDGDALGRIDLYRKGAFVLEAKQSRIKGGAKEVAGQSDLFSPGAPEETRGRRGAERGWDVLMLNAKRQAEEYARALPPSHGWPPFVLVCDVGHCIEVYADFSGQGKNYTQFPDRQGFRIYLEDLRDEAVRERLRHIWLDPTSLDPARTRSRVTREIAERLAEVSKALEAKKHPPEEVAHFLMRCLFTMFASSVNLLPENAFRDLLNDCRSDPQAFAPLLSELWRVMDAGGYSTSIRMKVLQFNGNLFKDAKVIPLGRAEIGELYAAAEKDWKEVEPAIFGTLLEQALDVAERARLGAHYTPRAYVERLVIATVIEPLREDWRNVQATAETKRAAGDLASAAAQVKAFHDKLCATRVLDPACGTGNFLYVSLELIKRLEGEVLEALLDLGGQEALRGLSGHTVDPHQFLGLELNPRAAAIAELVLWIGYLQWHFRTRGGIPEEPILKPFKNIEVKNAVLTWDGYPLPQVASPPAETAGRILPRAAGEGDHPKGGGGGALRAREDLPPPSPLRGATSPVSRGRMETASRAVEEERIRRETYPNARRPTWPAAEFIVGNPPFIGGKDIRSRLGDAFTEALWGVHKHINESADFVMYWWDRAAEILAAKGTSLRRFGLVTTNSVTQEFSRRVIKKRLEGKPPMSLVMAVNDHPWTKATDEAAQVRIAMTVAEKGEHIGLLHEVVREEKLDTDQPDIEFMTRVGRINADLTVGVDLDLAERLRANEGLAARGMALHGAGFIVTSGEAEHLGLGKRPGLEAHIRPYRNGRDLTARPRGAMVIDLFGLSADEVRRRFPEVYQHVLATVKPERDRNRRQYRRENWWLFGEVLPLVRESLQGLQRYVATVETMRQRAFVFLDESVLPDNKIVVVASADPFHLGVLSSSIHVSWALRAGGWLGVGNDPVYVKSKVFDPFPFPDPDDSLASEIRAVAEELDAHRKARQAEHPGLTLTQMYNVLEKLKAIEAARKPSPLEGEGAEPRSGEAGEGYERQENPSPGSARRASPPSPSRGEGKAAARRAAVPPLTEDEERIKDEGLILILKELHERLDRLVFQAYGWPETLSDEDILSRLVALNHERAAEERRGHVRWLRPDYQIPRFAKPVDKQAAKEEGAQVAAELALAAPQKPSFPSDAVGQTAAVFAALAAAPGPVDAAAIAADFRSGRNVRKKIEAVLASLARLGHVATRDGRHFEIRRAA